MLAERWVRALCARNRSELGSGQNLATPQAEAKLQIFCKNSHDF
jgi:hypothetical protein